MLALRFAFILTLIAHSAIAANPINDPSANPNSLAKVIPIPQEVINNLKTRGKDKKDFYKKAVNAGGLWILSSDKVDDRALLEARYLILNIMAGRPDVREILVKKNLRVGVMAHTEFTTDIPEHSRLPAWYNTRARGLGGNPVTCGAENVLNYKGDPYRAENILIHEVSHAFHNLGIKTTNPTFQTRWVTLFKKLKDSDQYAGYAMTNPGEFFAEAAQSWFDCNVGGLVLKKGPDGKKKAMANKTDIQKHIPEMHKLLSEAFGNNDWVYTRTEKRLNMPHLKGYDHTKAPVFKWPEHIRKAAQEARKKKK